MFAITWQAAARSLVAASSITRSDLLVINKIDLAPHVGASLEKMDTDARRMRGERPFVMTNLKKSEGLERIIGFIEAKAASARRRRPKPAERSVSLWCLRSCPENNLK